MVKRQRTRVLAPSKKQTPCLSCVFGYDFVQSFEYFLKINLCIQADVGGGVLYQTQCCSSYISSTKLSISPKIDFKTSYISCPKPLKSPIFYNFSNPIFWLRFTPNTVDILMAVDPSDRHLNWHICIRKGYISLRYETRGLIRYLVWENFHTRIKFLGLSLFQKIHLHETKGLI